MLYCLGEQDLSAPRHAEHTRQTVERSGKVVSSARFGLANMDCHTGAQRSELVGITAAAHAVQALPRQTQALELAHGLATERLFGTTIG